MTEDTFTTLGAVAQAVVEKIEPRPAPVDETTMLISVIERATANPAVDVDKLDRLLQMQERVMERRAKSAFDAALSIMQPELPQIDRNGRIVILSKSDREAGRLNAKPQQETPYATWEDINTAIGPHLAEHGFALSFRSGTAPDGKLTITGILSHKDGHREKTEISLQHDSSGSKNAVQAVGSSISYGKRYTAGMLLNFTSRAPMERDDDGKEAGGTAKVEEDQVDALRAAINTVAANVPAFLKYFKVESVEELPARRFDEAMKMLRQKGKSHV